MKLYRYGYVGSNKVNEIEAEGETPKFWVIEGIRISKDPGSYPDSTWYRTPQEAILAYIKRSKDKIESLNRRITAETMDLMSAEDTLRNY